MAKEIIKDVQSLVKNKVKPVVAYYLLEKNGGYEVYQATVEEGILLDTKRISDPDGWDQSIITLERALSKQFQ